MMEQKEIIVKGMRVCYYKAENLQKEKVIVFLHGWGSEALHFGRILSACQNFIAVDLPGFGKSDQPKEVWGMEEYAVFLRQFLQKLGISKPILVGHSFGGSILIKHCAAAGDAEKLILIAASGIRQRGFKIAAYNIVAKVIKAFFLLPGLGKHRERLRKRAYKAIGAEDYVEAGGMVEIYKKVIVQDLKNDLQKITVPTTIIWGAKDKDTPLDYGKIMYNRIPKSKLFIIEDAGHFVFIDQQEKFNAIFTKEIVC